MNSLLKEIIQNKKIEIQKRKRLLPINKIKKALNIKSRNLRASITKTNDISIIAEIKQRSPSTGVIIKDFAPIKIAQIYEQNGASGISVLTDKRFFGGELKYIPNIKRQVRLPILHKEFIIDEYQIYESRYLGADAILFIVKLLTLTKLHKFISIANEIGLTSLVEVHTQDELKKVLSIDPQKIMIGINNRNLDTLEVDIYTSLKLKPLIPDEYITVSESGLKTKRDLIRLEEAGFKAVLIGETLLRAEDIGGKLRKFLQRGNRW
jgi:indole-3-glycerol phosphate synthase